MPKVWKVGTASSIWRNVLHTVNFYNFSFYLDTAKSQEEEDNETNVSDSNLSDTWNNLVWCIRRMDGVRIHLFHMHWILSIWIGLMINVISNWIAVRPIEWISLRLTDLFITNGSPRIKWIFAYRMISSYRLDPFVTYDQHISNGSFLIRNGSPRTKWTFS